ncbi:MAG: hypothetical protein ACRD8W_09985 [Nitrososphaeraceae archaeon]
MKISILISILIAILITDMMISTFFDFIAASLTSELGILLFFYIGMITYILGLYLLLKDIKYTSSKVGARNRFFKIIHETTSTVQYIIIAILVLVTIQMILTSKFSTIAIIAATVISYVPASITFGYISYKFLLWYKSNKKDIPVIVYAFAFIMVCIAVSINTVVYSAIMLHEKPTEISPQLQVQFREISLTSFGVTGVLYIAGFVPLIFGFTAAWAGTALLLGKHSLKTSRLKFLIIVSLPLASYLIAILPTLLAVPDLRFIFDDPDLIYFRILFKSAVVAGGVLFGMVFLTVARSIRSISSSSGNESTTLEMSNYARIAGYGVAMLTILLASQVDHATYPPFGVTQ